MRADTVDLSVPGLAALHERRSEKWAAHEPDVLVSTIAEMDFPLAPPIAAALHAAIDRHDAGYAPAEPDRFREAFAGFAARRMGWTVDPAQVAVVPDVMVGLVELCRVLAPAGEPVAFATPAYPPFHRELPHEHLELPLLPGDDGRAGGPLDLGALDRALAAGARVLVLANPHNPTGRALRRAELEAIADVCASHDAWVLADEIHAPLVLPGAEHVPWLEVSHAARERGVALTSASKAFNLGGVNAALVVTASDRARDAVARVPPLADRSGLFGVLAAEAAFAHGDEWLDALIAQLDANRTLLAERLRAELPDVRFTPPEATYLAWLDCRALGLGGDPAATFLARGRVALSPGPDYGAPGAGFVRFNFGTSPELVAEAVRRTAASV